jgi:hypothetical protein
MSGTHKPKPPDKGEAAPKPSRKVAIEEVLRSLQDLVNNELSVDNPPPGTPQSSPPATAPAAPDPEVSAALTPAEPAPVAAAPVEVAAEPAHAGKRTSAARGLQQDLPFLDAASEHPGPVPEPAAPSSLQAEAGLPVAESPASDDLEVHPSEANIDDVASVSQSDELPHAPTDEILESSTLESTDGTEVADDSASSPHDSDLHDIPVLEDAVDLTSDEPEPHETWHEPGAPTPVRPTPQDGRRVAIQVAARLNVELRKAGQPGLDSDVIARLARLLEEALANDASNMDNSAGTKD